MSEYPMRLNKYLAHAGYATRRSADVLIEAGKVLVNGKKAYIGQKVDEGDKVELKTTDAPKFRYILYYKPKGVITHSPEEDEVDIASRIMKDHKISGVFPVGRLDKGSEGLIVLTNDGRITERLLSPELKHEKEYEVSVDKKISNWFVRHIEAGVDIEGYITKPAKAVINPKNDRLVTITLTEGKKHQIRRMCAALGYQVTSLKRTRIMDFTLRKLKPGQFHELNKFEVEDLYEKLGLR